MKVFINSLLLISLVFIFMGCGESDTDFFLPTKDDKTVTEKTKNLTASSKVDILFVVDDSASMRPVQTALANNIDKFLNDFAQMKFIDFHVGVLASEIYASRYGFLIGSPNVVTNKTPDLINTLKRNILVGSSASGTEGFFDPVHIALTDPGKSAANAGFYRDEAYFVVIFITDAEDQSRNIKTATDFYDFLLTLKGGDSNKLLTFGAMMPNYKECTSGERPQVEILKFFDISGGSYFNICQDDFGKELSKMSQSIYSRTNFIPMSQVPYLKSVKVTYGTQIIPHDRQAGWSYDSNRVGIFFGPDLKLIDQDDVELKISYTPADVE